MNASGRPFHVFAIVALVAGGCSPQQSTNGLAPTPVGSSSAGAGTMLSGLGSGAAGQGGPGESPSPDTATMQFGLVDVGSPFPPSAGHDASAHAADSVVPRTVVVTRGGTVTFNLPEGSVHQVAVYEPGTEPADIDTTVLVGGGCFGVPLIDDPDGRLAVLGPQPCAGGPTQPSFVFDAPGRYLVICTFLPHFEEAEMWAWVTVR